MPGRSGIQDAVRPQAKSNFAYLSSGITGGGRDGLHTSIHYKPLTCDVPLPRNLHLKRLQDRMVACPQQIGASIIIRRQIPDITR